MAMRVVYWARLQLARQQVLEALNAVPGAELTVVETLADLLGALNGAEALVLYDAPPEQARRIVDALSAPGNTVRWMHFLTAGREGFDAVGLPPAVAVTHPAGCVSPTVAEHAMTLLLALVRRVPAMLEEQAKGNWSRLEVSAKATSVEGKVMAIVGYGQIGREIALRARPFGIRIIAVSRTPKSDELLDESYPLSELDQVLARADIVMLTIALTAETRHLFDRQGLQACKPGVVLINVARGGLVDQQALAAALASGHVGAAGLDVVDPEPLPATDPLWSAPNLIISPHFAGGGSMVSQMRLAESAAANLIRLIKKEPLQHLVS
jgi:phosphoglycerate dehydrogenase-like enzyme